MKKTNFIGICGKSGSGKTTIVDLLAGIYMPHKGSLIIDNTEIKVPIHFPNKIPEISKSGEPKPSKDIQIKQNKKNIRRFI